MSYVEMKSVVKAFGQTEVIHGVDLSVEKEEFTVFVGPSVFARPLSKVVFQLTQA